jgi:hypothetical protein
MVGGCQLKTLSEADARGGNPATDNCTLVSRAK